MAITTSAAENGLFSDIFERALFVARETNLMTQLVSNFSANNFFTREFATRPQLTSTIAYEGVDYSNAQLYDKTPANTLTPHEQMVQVVVTDIAVMNDREPLVQSASQEMGEAMAYGIDRDLIEVFKQFTTDIGPGAGVALTLAKVAAGVPILQTRHVGSNINIVLHPFQWHSIWTQLGQPQANYAFLGDAANAALRQYFVGSLLGVRWFTSSNVAIDGNNDSVGGMFAPPAIAFDSRIAPYMEPERDASLRAWELNMVAGYATGLGPRPTYGLKITSDASVPS